MIKEYAYYITTGRFSQITEDLYTAVRNYADSFENNKKGDKKLREKARLLCEEHLEKSGLRTPGNTYINIDTEFFENTELQEEKLNHFIKEVLKAHAFQKILWEYMGTTGLMTDISKECLKKEGKSYENLLPAALREKERQKQAMRLKFDFNKLKDNSGFDWSKGYDPNSTVEKNGWYGSYDKDGVWTYYKTDGEENLRTQKDKKVSKIIIVKNERGAMLYDTEEILLNPIILWYLTHNNEVYGELESDTLRILENIEQEMKTLGVEKITEVVCQDKNSKTKKSEYKKVLGTLADTKLKLQDKESGLKILEKQKEEEKKEIVEHKNTELQNKIDAILSVKPEVKTEEIVKILENGTVTVPLNIQNKEDSLKIGFTEQEYTLFNQLQSKLTSGKKESFSKSVANLYKSWSNYQFSELSKEECIQKIFDFIQNNQNISISYEAGLKQVLLQVADAKKIRREEVYALIKNELPQENQEAVQNYIENLPEQKRETEAKVYSSLYNAIKNYLDIRTSTGLSIKELLDYAVKVADGVLAKEAFVPVTGYISSIKTDNNNPEKEYEKYRIYYEKEISKLYEELISEPVPEKEVSLSLLEEQYKEQNKTKTVLKISTKKSEAGYEMVYDTDDDTISPVILAILKKIKTKEGKTESKKIISAAKKSKTAEDFIKSLKKDYQIEYELGDKKIRELYAEQNCANLNLEFISDYQQEYKEEADRIIAKEDYKSQSQAEIKTVYKEVELETEALPEGKQPVTEYSSTWRDSIELKVIQQRKIEELFDSSKEKDQTDYKNLTADEKTEVVRLMNSMNKTEREEFFHCTGDDWDILTPLLIKEYLWRKKQGRSLKNLTQEVQSYQKLKNLSPSEYESFAKILALSEHKHIHSGESTNPDSKVNVTSESGDKGLDSTKETSETNVSESKSDTPAPEGSPTETNPITQAESAADVNSLKYVDSIQNGQSDLAPSLYTEEQKSLFKKLGIAPESLSPVARDYIQDLIESKSASEQGSNSVIKDAQTSSAPVATIKIPTAANHEIVNLHENTGMTPELKEAFKNAINARKKRSQTSQQSQDESSQMDPNDPMTRYNRNFEHDRAMLAKTDPLFLANDRMHDVDHADGEEIDLRYMKLLSERIAKNKLDEIEK